MTLAQIMRLAMLQLDEDPADIADFDELFRMYANDGYRILVDEYYKPVETVELETDGDGIAEVGGMRIVRIVEAKDKYARSLCVQLSSDGARLVTAHPKTTIRLVFQTEMPPMETVTDEPRLPESAHSALVDYICYRYLQTGNLAKQSRAQAFQNSFYTAARSIRSANSGHVTRMSGLYSASDIRSR